jgi:hypothetical protein
MPDSTSRTQIVIAVIGLVGVLTAALISNWDKIFVKNNPVESTHSTVSPTAVPDSKPVNPTAVPDPTTRAPVDLKQDSLGDAPDAAMILSASPSPSTRLRNGDIIQFSIRVRYRLTTLENGTLTVTVEEFPNSNDCSGRGNTPVTGRAAIVRGEDIVTVSIPWTVRLSKSVTNTGSVGLGLVFWSDIHTGKLFRSFGPRPGYCYQLE